MNSTRTQYIIGALISVISIIVYLITMPSTISFWDGGEFAASALTLSIPHSPGAPLWLLIGKLITLLPFGINPALKLNVFSALFSGVTIFFLYLSTILILRKWVSESADGRSMVIVYLSAAIGALSFAFCDAFWAITSQSFISTFGTMVISLCLWLLFKWFEDSEKIGSDRMLLLLGFIIGLGIGVNFVISQIVLIAGIIFYFRNYNFSRNNFLFAFLLVCAIFLFMLPFITNWYPGWLSGNLKVFKVTSSEAIKWLAVLLFPVLILTAVLFYQKGRRNISMVLSFFILILAGYSVYYVLTIRAHNENLTINDNYYGKSASISSYLNNENNNIPLWKRRYSHDLQYVNTWKNYSGEMDFLLRYQVNHMFNRYLGWQYIGRGYEQDKGIDWSKFYGIPLFIGLFGLFYHFKKDWKLGISLLWLFLLMGILTAFYLNYQSPQPRERDYIYTGAYLIFSLWIGIGIMGIIDFIRNKIKSPGTAHSLSISVLALCFLFIPVNMLRVNFHYNNRGGNDVPLEYAYNMLQSVEKDGILFSNGDNNIYPLMYAQSIGFRQDVSIVNISLLNEKWYIKRLKDSVPAGSLNVPINFNDQQIDQLKPIKWGEYKQVSIPIPEKAFSDSIRSIVDIPAFLTWKISASIENGDSLRGVKVSDLVTLEIIKANNWKRPIYFASTISADDYIGLDDYLLNEGLAKKLVPFKDENGIQNRVGDNLYENLMKTKDTRLFTSCNGFTLMNFKNRSSSYDQVTSEIVQDYRSQYLTLAYFYLREDSVKVKDVLNKMEENFPIDVIPMDYRIQHDVAMLYAGVGEMQKFGELSRDVEVKAKEELLKNPNDIQSPWNSYKLLLDIYETRGDYQNALDILAKLENIVPGSPEVKMKIDALKSKMNGNN